MIRKNETSGSLPAFLFDAYMYVPCSLCAGEMGWFCSKKKKFLSDQTS